jgi:tRNA(Ile)-lysidine synthase
MDSTVLLHALAARRDRFASLRAIHVDHGLHGGSAGWAVHCREVCDGLGIALETRCVLVRQRSQGLEAAARDARFDVFADTLLEGETLVLAQHRDDQAETLLLRLMRGAGSAGLGSMRPERRFAAGTLARPLLELSRACLHDYAQAQGIAWLDDPSNTDMRHDRNHLRQIILPALRARWPQADQALATSARLAAEDAQLLGEQAARLLAGARVAGDPASLSVPALLALSPPWRAHALRAWFAERGLPPAPARLHARIDVELLAARRDATPELRWPGACLRRWRDRLHAIGDAAVIANDWERRWDGTDWLPLPDGSRLGFEARDAEASHQHPPGELREALRCDFGELRVQPRHGGERLRLPGRSHHHRLKHLLQAGDMPPWQRKALPLVYAGDGELLAAGDALVGARLAQWSRAHACALRWRRGQ